MLLGVLDLLLRRLNLSLLEVLVATYPIVAVGTQSVLVRSYRENGFPRIVQSGIDYSFIIEHTRNDSSNCNLTKESTLSCKRRIHKQCRGVAWHGLNRAIASIICRHSHKIVNQS